MDEAYRLATELDQLARDFDPYEYMDRVSDQEESIRQIAEDIDSCNIEAIEEFLQSVIEDRSDESCVQKARELVQRTAYFEGDRNE